MSFNSHDSDDADSDHGGNASTSDNVTHDDDAGSTDFILPGQTGSWEMKKINTVWVSGIFVFVTVSSKYEGNPVLFTSHRFTGD